MIVATDTRRGTSEWEPMTNIIGKTEDPEQGYQDILTLELSDEALEAAASMHAAITFPAAPTVSVLVVCCGNDYVTAPEAGRA